MPVPQARIAAAGGALVLAGFVLMPSGLLERLVLASGIPAVLAAAEPPLGLTARIALGGTLGALCAGFLWFGLKLMDDDGRVVVTSFGRTGIGRALLARLRRGDGHPDAPPRQPLFAQRELGEPTPPPPVERALPADLDQPLAAFDPAAIPDVPLTAAAPVEPLAPAPVAIAKSEPAAIPASPAAPRPALIDPGDRFETFELTPMLRTTLTPTEPAARPRSLRVSPVGSLRIEPLREAAPVVAPETETTVQALLARLERGLAPAAAGAAPVPAPTPAPTPLPTMPSLRTGRLHDALGDLRAMATATR